MCAHLKTFLLGLGHGSDGRVPAYHRKTHFFQIFYIFYSDYTQKEKSTASNILFTISKYCHLANTLKHFTVQRMPYIKSFIRMLSLLLYIIKRKEGIMK
jgi:hypothetical protein